MSTQSPTKADAVAASKATHVPHRWRNLITITGAEVVDNTQAGLLTTLFPSIATALKLDNGHLGLLGALGKFATIPLGPLWVWLADRFGRKRTLVLNNVVGAVLGILAGTSQTFLQLLLWNTLLAGVVACAQPITNSIIADSFDDRSRAKALRPRVHRG
ncbi:MFS transporter [Streptomyces sp. NBC_01378]|uniref:MFS transporter n=1 Tax=Streptomyces sp. NBC_01378 TaxID=2903844 RepID=UPI0032503271